MLDVVLSVVLDTDIVVHVVNVPIYYVFLLHVVLHVVLQPDVGCCVVGCIPLQHATTKHKCG